MYIPHSAIPPLLSLTHSIHSYYEVFVVESEVPPDTSTISADSDDVFIALADDAEPGVQLPEFVFGDGSAGLYVVDGGGRVEFENRELRGETIYYFFIRLHSSVVSNGLSPFFIS